MRYIWLIILFICVPLQATTYYLDDVNGNDSNDGLSEGEAWKTLDHSIDTVTGGDIITLADGNYGDYYRSSSVNLYDSWVTYESKNLHGAEITRIELSNSTAVVDGYLIFDGFTIRTEHEVRNVRSKNFNHLKFLNLDLIGDGYHLVGSNNDNRGIYIWGDDSNDVEIDNCKIRGLGNNLSGFGSGVSARGTNITVTDCNISQCHTGVHFLSIVNGTITGNVIHEITSDGILFGRVDNLLIENNEVYNLVRYDPTLDETPTNTTWSPDGKTMTNANAHWNTPGDTLVTTNMEIYVNSGTNVNTGDENCWVSSVVSDTEIILGKSIGDGGGTPSNVDYRIQSSTHLDAAQAGSTSVSDDVTISKNKFYNVHGQICWFNPASSGGHNWLIENNLFYDVYTSAAGLGGEENGTVRISAIDGLTFRNNIVIGSLEIDEGAANYTIVGNIISYADRWGAEGAIIDEGYNIVNRRSNSFVFDETTIFLDGAWDNATFRANFNDFDVNDFTHADSDACGVSHGDPNNYPLTDILGIDRDGSPDAGAYEDTTLFVPSGPPEPNPATWDSVPAADGNNAISMTATSATSGPSPYSYFFQETTGNPGTTDSGWQVSDATYTDSGLDGNTVYTYRTQIRDTDACTGVWSNTIDSNGSATPTDTNAPVPDPATFAVTPTFAGSGALTMAATVGSDDGVTVYYYFNETSGNTGGTDSGWQLSPTYTDSGLLHNIQYTYTVQLRDSVPNTGTASSGSSALATVLTGTRSRWNDGYRRVYRSRYRY